MVQPEMLRSPDYKHSNVMHKSSLRPLYMVQEKEITDSSKPNTGDLNNNNVAKKPYRPPVKKRKLK